MINFVLCPEPRQRLDLDDIRAHPWFTGEVLSSDALTEYLADLKAQITQRKISQRMDEENTNVRKNGQGSSGSAELYRGGDDVDPEGSELPASMEFFVRSFYKRRELVLFDDEVEVVGAAELFQETRWSGCYSHFTSIQHPFTMFKLLLAALIPMCLSLNQKQANLKMKGCVSNGLSISDFTVQVLVDSQGHSEVVFTRISGSGLQFRSMFSSVCTQLHHVIEQDLC